MTLPAFFSSLIIANSAFAGLLFAVLTFLKKEYKAKPVICLLTISIILLILTNILIVCAFYQSDPSIDKNFIYPLIPYILGMVIFMLSGIYFILGRPYIFVKR